jgi:hypothetical protein
MNKVVMALVSFVLFLSICIVIFSGLFVVATQLATLDFYGAMILAVIALTCFFPGFLNLKYFLNYSNTQSERLFILFRALGMFIVGWLLVFDIVSVNIVEPYFWWIMLLGIFLWMGTIIIESMVFNH